MKIIIRVFPKTRRGSFTSEELELDLDKPTVNDIFLKRTDLINYNVSRGINYLTLIDFLIDGEILNFIPQ